MSPSALFARELICIGGVVREIAGDEHRIRLWPHRADRLDRRREPRHGITVGPLGSDVRIAELREEKWVAHDDIFVDEPTRRAPLVAALEPDPGHPLRMNLFEPCVSSNDCNASWQAAPSPSGLFLPAQGDNGRPKLWPSATRKCCVPFL